MKSIYQQAMGPDFERLHPKIQERFGLHSQCGKAAIGTGVMSKVFRGPLYSVPFLMVGTWRNIMFPAQGEKVPFRLENYPYVDRFGRETVTWIRKFQFPNRLRRFDATMIYSQQRQRVVDYLGNHQHLAVDIDLSVAENGGLHLRSGSQRFYEGAIAFSFPMFFSGYADVNEWFDDERQLFQIKVTVTNPVWGTLFGYRGAFHVDYIPTDGPPLNVLPLREEKRE